MRFDKKQNPALCATKEETRYAINGVAPVKLDGKLYLAATDGRMLSMIAAEADDGDEVHVMRPYPVAAFDAARKAAARHNPDATVALNGSAKVVGAGATAEFAALDQRFPDVVGVVPTWKQTHVIRLNAEFLAKLQKAMNAGAVAIRFTVDVKAADADYVETSMPMEIRPMRDGVEIEGGSFGMLMPISAA